MSARPRVFEVLQGYQQTAALKAAIELNLFTTLAAGHQTARALAGAMQCSERGVRILCDFLTISGLLTKEDDHWSLTEESAMMLDERSPMYMGHAVEFLQSETVLQGFNNLATAVREGGTSLPNGGSIAPGHPSWVPFARSMRAMMSQPAQVIADMVSPLPDGARVLDVAASHGEFGLAVARRNSKARVVALDWPNVLDLTRQNVAAEGLTDNYSFLGGSAFEVDLGDAYDVALVTNFLHHFDTGLCVSFLRRLFQGLKPGGRVVLLEFVPNEDRVSPPPAAGFSLTMLAMTPHGDAYTRSELEGMLTEAGFDPPEFRPLPMTPETILMAAKPS